MQDTSMTTDDITAIIPLRANSKGLPGKNKRMLAGKALFLHSVECAQAAGITDIIVATDDAEILQSPRADYDLFERSKSSASDTSPTHDVLIEVIKARGLLSKTIVLLQATSPLRSPETVTSVVKRLSDENVELACSVSEIDNGHLKSGTLEDDAFVPLIDASTLFKPRQSLPKLYKLDGSVYAFRGAWLVENGSLETDKIKVVESDPSELLDIDTLADFERAQQILDARNASKA